MVLQKIIKVRLNTMYRMFSNWYKNFLTVFKGTLKRLKNIKNQTTE